MDDDNNIYVSIGDDNPSAYMPGGESALTSFAVESQHGRQEFPAAGRGHNR